MSEEETLNQIEHLKNRVKEIVKTIQISKRQLEQSRISYDDFKVKKATLEEELRKILKQISLLKDTVQFSLRIQKETKAAGEEPVEKIHLSEKAKEFVYYFQTEFEELFNKASVYLSGTMGTTHIELGFFELFYPPIAQKNKPFNVTGLVAQRGVEKLSVKTNLVHIAVNDNKDDLYKEAISVELPPERAKAITFRISANSTHIYSLRALLSNINDHNISEKNDIFFNFEVKTLPFTEKVESDDFFDTRTGKYLIYSYLACEKEEEDLLKELQISLNELGVNTFEPLLKIIPEAQKTQSLIELGRYINETIIFFINNFETIKQYYRYEKMEEIEHKLLDESERLFKFAPDGIILEPFENLGNALKLSMLFRSFYKLCKLGYRKLTILQVMLNIGREYGYDISKYFLYIKSIKSIPIQIFKK